MSDKMTLNKYEQLVDEVIEEALMSFQGRYKVKKSQFQDDYVVDTAWEIKPLNPKAASIQVYGVDEKTVNISIEEYFWMEFFMSEDKFKDNLSDVKKTNFGCIEWECKNLVY